MKSAYDEAVRLLPSKTAAALGERFKAAEEFRLRAGRYPSALIGGREEVIADKAVTCDDIACVLEKATNASLHSVWQDMSRGFISCGFGLRIGVCGTGVISGGKLTGLRDISSVSIRIPKQTTECGGEILKKLCTAKDNVLIISPPGGGKTTFLRSIIRYLDTARRIFCVADERGELLTAGHTVHCDVYTRCTKAQAIQMALRCMNPQVIVCDELGTQADLQAVEAGLACGVVFVASVHCDTLEALNRKPPTARLLAMGAFETLVLLDGRVNPGHAVKVRTLA